MIINLKKMSLGNLAAIFHDKHYLPFVWIALIYKLLPPHIFLLSFHYFYHVLHSSDSIDVVKINDSVSMTF